MTLQPDDDIDARIGIRLHGLRIARNITLDGLAGRSGVSRAMLSRIERGDSSPTAQLLVRVCGGLGVTLSALLAYAEPPPNPLARRRDQPLWRDPASGYQRRSVSPPRTGSPIDIVEIEFPPGSGVAFDNLHLGGADQHVWVLDGCLDVAIGAESFRLAPGDCLHMRLDRPVRFTNGSGRPARYAVILNPGAPNPDGTPPRAS